MSIQKCIKEFTWEEDTPIMKLTAIEEHNDPPRWHTIILYTSDPEFTIVMKLSNSQKCCEEYGLYFSERRLLEIIGQPLQKIQIYSRESDTFRNYKNENSVIVKFITQANHHVEFTLYCAHNGYYPHEYYMQFGKDYMAGNI